MIRVGRILNSNDRIELDGFVPIVVMTKSSKYGSLSPYELKIDGMIIENIWQFSKIYEEIPASKQPYSRYVSTVIWNHPAEKHFVNGKITQEYLHWRTKGFNNKYAVRYPVGYNHRHKCIGSIIDPYIETPILLNYIDTRKKIYLPYYVHAVRQQPQFQELKQMLSNNINILIMEVDGPHQESLSYYQEKYKVDDNFINKGTMLATKENLEIMLNDDKHPFGHGYCLAKALLD